MMIGIQSNAYSFPMPSSGSGASPLYESSTSPENLFALAQNAPPLPEELQKKYTRIDIKGYRPEEFYYNKASSWLQVQARNLIDINPLDKAVQTLGKQINHGKPYVDNSKNVFELMGLDELDTLGKRANIEDLFTGNSNTFKNQLAFQRSQLGKHAKEWMATPQSFMQGSKQFLHGSFTKPFTNLASGKEVLSSSLSAFASVLFGVDIANKTHRAYKSAYNSGQRDGELAQITGQEFAKETFKSGAAWMAGSAGASLVGRTFGTNLGFINEAGKLGRLKSLPMRLAYIVGGVLAGSTVQAGLDWALPSLPVVEKVSLAELRLEKQKREAEKNETPLKED
jgi:hypothetical protein